MNPTFVRTGLIVFLFLLLAIAAKLDASDDKPVAAGAEPISFYRQVKPIFQAQCHGCHQPAKPKGDYVMTSFEKLLGPGESGAAAIIPGKPGESPLVKLITPTVDEAEMPKGKPPLSADQIRKIEAWIAQGARDDTPDDARIHFNAEHPPTYKAPPVITSLDFSPDGSLLAVAGYYEVLLHKADGTGLVARLIGGSERIESVRFSPDGKLLAATGGTPGESGEVQIWDVGTRTLKTSLPLTFDVIRGASWSPDGKLLAFGCGDKTVRAIDVASGRQVLYQGTHEDRVLDTDFSSDGSHVVSVSQDQTVKLTEIATQRFIDNVTSITPGALSGGVNSVRRHPKADAILVGGADGEPKLYHIFRHTKRVIGDDANLIRRFPAMRGRVIDVAISLDGEWAAACSSLDNTGQVRVYRFAFEMELPPDVKTVSQKKVEERTAAELKLLADFATKNVAQVSEFDTKEAGLYAVTFRPDGHLVATAGTDGKIRLISAQSGLLEKEFVPVPVQPATPRDEGRPSLASLTRRSPNLETESISDRIVGLEIQPAATTISKPFDTVQLLVTGVLESGERIDLTRVAKIECHGSSVAISPRGLVTVRQNGRSEVTVQFGDKTTKSSFDVQCGDNEYVPDYVRDVSPILSKIGCNVGTCHGANKGKGGFKLSLRGNDPLFDVRAYSDELSCRRLNFAAPDRSLMLAKTSANVPHEGGQLAISGEAYYEVIRRWITHGAKLDQTAPRVTRLEIVPQDPIVQRIGTRQQFRVVATLSDGTKRDVTAESYIDSGNAEVATFDSAGLASTLRRGEASILARYEGTYVGTSLVVMGDRAGFTWNDPPAYNFIDELVYAKLKRTKSLPSGTCNDAEFIRRVSLDLTGLPPTSDEVKAFIADDRDSRLKRDELIDRLIGNPDYVDHWTNKWADLLQVNRKYLGVEGATAFRNWIKDQVAANRPYDQFVNSLLTAQGSNRENPAASYFKIHRDPASAMETATHLFLGIRFNCNKCHDHPFERWTQDQYYDTAAWLARVGLKKDPEGGDKMIGGTAVEGSTPLYEVVYDKDDGEVKHDRTGAVTPPKFPFAAGGYGKASNQPGDVPPTTVGRRQQLAQWMTAPDNNYFARSYANRIWAYLIGSGLIDPIDDIRAGNPPTNAPLLDRLTEEFVVSKYDVRHLIRTICRSRTYQLSIQTNKWNEDDSVNYSHAIAKRLPAEVLFDSLYRVTGSKSKVAGSPEGARAETFLDPEVNTSDGFLSAFGRPPRESACECERSSGVQFGPVMAMVGGATVGNSIVDPSGGITKLVADEPNDAAVIRELYLRILSRVPTESEVGGLCQLFESLPAEHEKLLSSLAKLEAEEAPRIAEREQRRQVAISDAQRDLSAYQQQIASREAELDQKHQKQIETAESELNRYESTLADKLAAWEKRPDKEPQWTSLNPHDLSSTSATTLIRQEDLSVVSASSNGLGTYKVMANTDLNNITAVRLEAMTHDESPKKGPGRSPDGNFVLTEFEMFAASADDPAKSMKIALEHPRADFSQTNFDVETAIDGKLDPVNNGWAIAPKTGMNHVAVFDVGTPITASGTKTLTFLLHQNYQSGEHSLGHFRLSVTTSAGPILLDKIPEAITSILAVQADQRNDTQRKELLDYFRSNDSDLKRYQKALAESRKPRAVDPKLTALQQRLAEMEMPIPVPPKLQQLRDDVLLSAKQLQNQRLTAAQDVAWALINSPAFLFNR